MPYIGHSPTNAGSFIEVDDAGDIRVQSGNPTADNSGTVVGTQTFTGTHVYKSNDDTLITGEAGDGSYSATTT